MTSERGANTNESHYQGYPHIYIKSSLYDAASATSRRYNNKHTKAAYAYRSEHFSIFRYQLRKFSDILLHHHRSRVKMCSMNIRKLRRDFLNEFFSSFFWWLAHKCQCWDFMRFLSHSRTKERFLNEIFVIFHLLLHWCCIALRSPCYPDIRYFFFLPFDILKSSLEEVPASCYVCLLSYYLAISIVGEWKEEVKISLRAMLENFSERKTFTLQRWARRKILERNAPAVWLSVN